MTSMRLVSSFRSEIVRVKWVVLAILVLAIAGGGAALYERHIAARQHTETVPVAVQSVSTVPVRVMPMVENIASYGNLVSQRSVNIVPQTPGQVKQILFSDGQTVTAGAALVLMDSSIAQAQVQATRAQSDTDTQNLRRTQSLSRQGSNPPIRWSRRNRVPRRPPPTSPSTSAGWSNLHCARPSPAGWAPARSTSGPSC